MWVQGSNIGHRIWVISLAEGICTPWVISVSLATHLHWTDFIVAGYCACLLWTTKYRARFASKHTLNLAPKWGLEKRLLGISESRDPWLIRSALITYVFAQQKAPKTTSSTDHHRNGDSREVYKWFQPLSSISRPSTEPGYQSHYTPWENRNSAL